MKALFFILGLACVGMLVAIRLSEEHEEWKAKKNGLGYSSPSADKAGGMFLVAAIVFFVLAAS
jgi:hypothetical protein